jgi:hypothetical protein
MEEKNAQREIISGKMSDLSKYEGNLFMVNNCRAIMAERHCSFRTSDCSSSADCLFGYIKDSMGCVVESCSCNTEPNGEMHHGDIIVTSKMKSMMSAPEYLPKGEPRAADISVARWTQYRQGKKFQI